MNVFLSTARVIGRSADVAVGAAGAVGGAAINGVIGGMQGTVTGVRNGLDSGSHSTPAAVLTIAAIGATGLVEWPVLLGVGGTALAVHQLTQRTGGEAKPTPSSARAEPRKRASASASARKPAKSAKSATARAPRKTTPRKTTASGRRAPTKR